MKLFMVLSVILASLMPVLVVHSCGPYDVSPTEQFNRSKRTNGTTRSDVEQLHSIKGYLPVSSVMKESARRGLEECKRQFKDERWNCSVADKYLQRELPFATREAALIRAISSAAVAHEFTHQCTQNRLPGCKCFKKKSEYEHYFPGCGDDIEFGQRKAKLFFHQLEKGNQASRKAVNLHNSKVGREVVQALSELMCKCHPTLSFHSPCRFRTCWTQLGTFKDVGAKLKQKYHNAIRVWFVDNKLQERFGDHFRAISSEDSRLVYLDPSPHHCVRNDTLGYRGMLGMTCKSFGVNATECNYFIEKCKSCNLGYQTVEHEYEEVNKCNCKFHWCCYVQCEKCKKMSYITTCTSLESRK